MSHFFLWMELHHENHESWILNLESTWNSSLSMQILKVEGKSTRHLGPGETTAVFFPPPHAHPDKRGMEVHWQ